MREEGENSIKYEGDPRRGQCRLAMVIVHNEL